MVPLVKGKAGIWSKLVGWNGFEMSINMRGRSADISDEFLEWVGCAIGKKQEEGAEIVASNVDFSSCKLSNEDLCRIIDLLEIYNVQCHRLKLFDNKISEVERICRFLDCSSGQQIREIHLSHNELDDAQCTELVQKCAELGPNPKPIWLRIEHNKVESPESVIEGLSHPQVVQANGVREVPDESSVAIHRSFFDPDAKTSRPRGFKGSRRAHGADNKTVMKPVLKLPAGKGMKVFKNRFAPAKVAIQPAIQTQVMLHPNKVIAPQPALNLGKRSVLGRTLRTFQPTVQRPVLQKRPVAALTIGQRPAKLQKKAHPIKINTAAQPIKMSALRPAILMSGLTRKKIPVPPIKMEKKIPVPPRSLNYQPPTSKAAGFRPLQAVMAKRKRG